MKLIPFIAFILCFSGCASTGTGRHWWVPTTWFSSSEATKVSKLEDRVDTSRDQLIKAAQKTSHETQEALAAAPASRPVDVAVESNNQTVAVLDQAAGPLTANEVVGLRNRVANLLSENAEVRAKAEKERAKDRETIGDLSDKLAKVQAKLDAAESKLPDALRREAAIANKYRTLMWGAGCLLVLAVILGVGVLYLKIVYGGVPAAIGRGLSAVYAAHPDVAQNVELLLSKHLSPSQLSKVLGHSA